MKKFVWMLFLLAALCACEGAETWPNEKFDSSVWKATPEEDRYKVAQDLVSNKLLIGKSKSEIVELLGAPSSESDLPNMTYVIKVGGGGFNKIFILDVRFVDGRAAEVLIRGD